VHPFPRSVIVCHGIFTGDKLRVAIIDSTPSRRLQRRAMPHILVTAESSDEHPDAILLQERISSADLESDHFSGQLIQRVGWALVDAEQTEADKRSRP
jgi:hypothetical protein